jgi:hypothetical protein
MELPEPQCPTGAVPCLQENRGVQFQRDTQARGLRSQAAERPDRPGFACREVAIHGQASMLGAGDRGCSGDGEGVGGFTVVGGL